MREEVKRWMAQSARDLITAKNSIKAGDYYAAAFWCEQSAEKALKALLIKKSGNIIKIHDLIILGKKVNLPEAILEKCDKLNNVYLDSRYGDLGGTILSKKFNKSVSSEFLETAKEVLKWAEKNI